MNNSGGTSRNIPQHCVLAIIDDFARLVQQQFELNPFTNVLFLTVFLTTHYMEEAAEADYVVIIDDGKISAEGTPLELKNTYSGDYITIYNVDEKDIKALDLEYERIRNGYRISVPNTKAATGLIIRNPQLFNDYEITKGKMDDVFLAVTGKTLVGGEK